MWRLEHMSLVLKHSEQPHSAAYSAEHQAYAVLRAETDTIVSDYLSRIAAPTKKLSSLK